MTNRLAADLDHVLAHTAGFWQELRGQRLFMTGGTGFFGCWLLESFAWAHDHAGLDATAWVLTRNPNAFRAKAPHLAAHPAIRLCAGDVGSFESPVEEFSTVIHAATETGVPPSLSMFDANVGGTHRVLEFARGCGCRRLLLASSGAVYGPQPPEMTHVAEDYPGAPPTTDSATAYGQGKRACEYLCASYSREHSFEAKIARCFAFVGPYLPLDINFAVGNFIRDALKGGPIQVSGDGTPFRSYLYAADLAIWLWTVLFRGTSCRPYNVGSENAVSIADLARMVAEVSGPGIEVRIARPPQPGVPAARYVPATGRARDELGLREWVSLPDAIRRTVAWGRS